MVQQVQERVQTARERLLRLGEGGLAARNTAHAAAEGLADVARDAEGNDEWTRKISSSADEVRGLIEGLRSNQGTERIAVLRKKLQDEMDRKAQVFRTEESLGEVLEVIEELRERYKNVHVDDKGKRFNTDLLEAVELGFLLDIAEVVVVTARNRKESRGGHMRDDFPHRDDENYMQHTMAYLTGDPHSSHAEDHIELDWKPVVFTRNDKGELNYPPMERKY